MARPTKLTPALEKKVCDALRAGNYRYVAATLAGIGITTFDRWMADERALYRAFRAAVELAEAQAEAREVAIWMQSTDWRAAEAWLKRRHKDRWGDQVAVTGADGEPLKIVVEYADRPGDAAS